MATRKERKKQTKREQDARKYCELKCRAYDAKDVPKSKKARRGA